MNKAHKQVLVASQRVRKTERISTLASQYFQMVRSQGVIKR